MSRENVPNIKYRADVDGLRAVAVLSVVIYHAFPGSMPGGFAGVDVFFVISGFLISTILLQKIDCGIFSIWDFYSRRIRRIFPALIIVLFSVLVFGWFCLFPEELRQLGKHAFASAGFIQNFVLWKESGYFDTASETKPLLHIWSLGIEEQFYFIWPLLLWIAGSVGGGAKYRRKIFYFASMSSVFMISFALNLQLIEIDPTKAFYLPQYRIWELAAGGILSWLIFYQPMAVFKHEFFGAPINSHAKMLFKDVLSFAGIIILFIVFIKFNKNTIFPGLNALFPVFATISIISSGEKSFVNRKILSNKILVWFGLISFPLYLWHWPLLSVGRIIYGEEPKELFRLLAVIVSIVLSWLTVKFIEKPFRFGKNKLTVKVSALCVVAFAVGVFGYSVSREKNEMTSSAQQKGTESLISSALLKCKKMYPEWVGVNGTDQWCKMEKENNSIVLVGDSHAGHLYYGFVDTLKNTRESVAVFPASCAAPFLNISTTLTDLANLKIRKNNWKLINKAFEYIGKTSSVHTVYLSHNPDCSFGEGDAVDMENPSIKDTETVLKNGLSRTLKFLISKNKNIVIVLDNPYFPFEPGRCLSRGKILDYFKNGCDVEIFSSARARYKRLVNEIASGHPNRVKVVDLTPLFCHSGKCSPLKDGKLLYPYRDGGHLNSEGSVFVSDYLLKATL